MQQIFISRQARGNPLCMESFINARQNKTYCSTDLPRQLHGASAYTVLRSDGKLTNIDMPKHSLRLNKIYFWNSKTKIVKISTQQTYRRFYWRNTSLSSVVQLSRPVELIGSRAFGSLIIQYEAMHHGIYEIPPFPINRYKFIGRWCKSNNFQFSRRGNWSWRDKILSSPRAVSKLL